MTLWFQGGLLDVSPGVVTIPTPPPPEGGDLLLQDGTGLLLQDGTNLLLQS